ncbi:hypothetical protein FS837_012125 [Tulasnella sp. UAMH 9824]|nr:hypothetical protein FS837_012125 [Tulasnella sp. UAMH 9824]
MSLSTLINGADCGPSNALQGLKDRFDGDRGAAGDQVVPGRAGHSREVFRSQPSQVPAALAQEAAQFFNGGPSRPAVQQPSPFDLGSLNAALVNVPQRPVVQSPTVTAGPSSAWATDFVKSDVAAQAVSAKPAFSWAADFAKQEAAGRTAAPHVQAVNHAAQVPHMAMQSPPYVVPFHAPPFLQPGPALAQQLPLQTSTPVTQASATWASHFSEVENLARESEQTSVEHRSEEAVVDDLASTAGLLIDQLKNERSEKFKNSSFMKLMRQVRDREMVVSGDNIVPSEGVLSPSALEKGKMKAIDPSSSTQAPLQRRKSVHFDEDREVPTMMTDDFEDWADTETIPEVRAPRTKPHRVGIIEAQEAEWARLQEQYDEWEAMSTGFQAVGEDSVEERPTYQFQQNNPYLNQHVERNGLAQNVRESILEKEAHVQRHPLDAQAWFELGVRQQENEREGKAIVALKRALELDPTLLPAWLSLATSHTNEGSRQEALDTLQQWVINNEQYKIITAKYHLTSEPSKGFVSMREKRETLVKCLIEMATKASEVGVQGIDPDVQIALAVLLNTSDDYDKAVDCFKAALEARPDDWVLYNRVGATLANSGRANEALAYYYRALEYNPTYIRARYNMGIACINLKRYDEAASHLLDALVLQESDAIEDVPGEAPGSRGVTSSSLWDTLRTTSNHLQRSDLVKYCETRDLDAFRSAFHSQ